MRRTLVAALLLALAAAAAARQDDGDATRLVRRVGRVTIAVETRHAHPGGLVPVVLTSTARLGSANAILDGRRVPFYPRRGGSRALLPVGVNSLAGPSVLGVEILGRRSRQRVPVELTITPRAYPARSLAVLPAQAGWPREPRAQRDGRRLLQALRGLTSAPLASERFQAPVAGQAGDGFGGATSFVGLAGGVESGFDALAGEYHRGLDFDLPAGTPVRAPADGRVVLVASLRLPGLTLVIDHGEAVASVLSQLDAATVVEGQAVRAGEIVGRSGRSGFAAWPHLHWGTYVHAVPVDPRVFLAGLD